MYKLSDPEQDLLLDQCQTKEWEERHYVSTQNRPDIFLNNSRLLLLC